MAHTGAYPVCCGTAGRQSGCHFRDVPVAPQNKALVFCHWYAADSRGTDFGVRLDRGMVLNVVRSLERQKTEKLLDTPGGQDGGGYQDAEQHLYRGDTDWFPGS